jgi:capsular polysaccharide export protein
VNPYSQEALHAARAMGLKTWILENGYQRPDWITLETDGVNARSGLPREASAYDDADQLEPPADGPHIGGIAPFHAFNTIAHYTLIVLFSPWMRGYRYPFTVSIHGQVFGHTRRYAVALSTRKARERQAERVAKLTPYFLVCLQREGDSQLMVHSELKTNRAFMETVIASFAAHAPADARLAIKNHPLDPGLTNLEREAFKIAATWGVQHRVSFLEGGNFAALARASRGVVGVNSTAALAAAGFGTPVKLLGRAFFDIPGLVDQQPLEGFWSDPAPPDHGLFLRFRRRMSVQTQIYGSYHNPRSLTGTADRLAERLMA